ncbi:MAG: ABC transporter substrate-binding protein [Sphingomonadales bacterium]|nr:ABC transporter substrate-binding protein [Sphingomonadales bacterium]
MRLERVGSRGACFAASVALILAACAPARRAEAPRPHPTIVSLNPCTDAILAEVADPAQVLALSHYSRDPASSSMDVGLARRFASVGDGVEEVAALRPDVVVSGTFVAPATAQAFARLGFRQEAVPMANTVEQSEVQVRQLAALTGHPARGEALVARMRAALAAAGPPPGSHPVSAVVWQSGGMVPGQGTLIADLLRRTGFVSLSAARGLQQADILPLERMLADPPQVILAAGNPRAEEDRLLAHPALAALKGTRRERLDSSLLWCGGPTVIRAAQRLGQVRRGLRDEKPLPLAGGVWGVPHLSARSAMAGPPPAPPASGRDVL